MSPENQDRVIMAIEQLLRYENKNTLLKLDPEEALRETKTDIY